jgi:hypothetical protein
MAQKVVKMIALSERNYGILKDLGNLTDSFDSVVTRVLSIAVPKLAGEEKH